MSPQKPSSAAIEAWLEGTLPQEEATAIDAYFEANPDALPGASDEEDFGEMADYVTETGASLDALVERMKTSPGLESQWAAPSSDSEWQELLEPGPMLGTLGPYEVEELIATGGMGILFKARDPKLARTVALKVLSPQLANTATARERFLREARAAAKLEHENILPIYAVHDGAVPYFSMRYADGGTLEELIKKSGTLDLPRLKSVARQVSSALEAAHDGGVIHRDIKPANILLEAGGELCWVCDFGIARSVEDPSLTYAGNIAGTPHHMSPEQAEGKALDGRSDLFSLGTVLYRAATGQHAFKGDTTVSVLKSVAGDQPKPAGEINAELPEWFEHLLATLLAKDPGNRPPNATAVIKALDAERAPPPPKPRCPAPIAWVGLAALAIASLVALIAFLPNRNPVRQQAGTPVSSESFITIEGDKTRYTDLSEAIAAAGDGATLLLSGDFRCPETVFTRHAQSIHLRCAPGANATVTAETPGRHAIFFQGPATLEGIRFVRLKSKPHCRPIVGIRAAEGIVVTNCEFQTPVVSDPRFGGGALGVSGRMSTISRCRFDTPGSAAIFFAGGSIQIEECVAVGHRLIYRREENNNSPRTADITIERCIAHCDELFYSSYDQPLYPAVLTVRDSLLDLREHLFVLPDSPADTIRQSLSWTGENNHYPSNLTLVSAPKMKAGDDFVPSTFATPSDLPKASENNPTYGPIFDAQELFTQPTSAELHAALAANIDSPALSVLKAFVKQGDRPRIVGRVRIEGEDQIFPDLSSAVSAAPDGATLLLSGDIHCPEPVVSRRGQSIHLRPALGATPSIIADDPLKATLLFRGPTTIEGIRFSRPNAVPNSLPIVAGSRASSLVVTDCVFEVSSVAPNRLGSGALGCTNQRSEITRCRFDTPGGGAILVGDGGKVHIEECVAVGHRFIYRRERIPDRTAQIVIERSVVLCGELFSGSHHNPLYPTSLTVRDSLLDLRDQLLVLPDSPAHLIWENLSWTGENNHYPSNVTLLTAPRMGAGTGFVASTFKTVSELPGATEKDPTYGPLFDRQHLPTQPTTTDLRVALPEGIDSPALRALDDSPPPANHPSPTGSVKIEGSEQPFADLSKAIVAAADGATLLLSGDIHCPEPVSTPRGKTIHFRAAEGATTTVIASAAPALIIQGPTSVKGITFSRPPAIDTHEPIVSVRSAPSADFEDCAFHHLVTDTKRDMPGLNLTGISEATIRNCVFRMPGCFGIDLRAEVGQNASLSTSIEDSVFISRATVSNRYAQIGDHEGTGLQISRSVIQCERIFNDSKAHAFQPLSLKVTDCLIDSTDTLIWVGDEDLDAVLENLVWQGSNNTYGNGLRSIVKTPRISATEGFTPRYVRSFEDLLRVSPESAEADGRETLIFDGIKPRTPYKVEDLSAALRPGVPWPVSR